MHAWALAPVYRNTKGALKGNRIVGDTEPKLTLLDMPGYGYGSNTDWGKDIIKYLTRRRQLRRAFVLINPIHGLKETDLHTLELLRSAGISHQLIACKCDEIQLPVRLSGLLEEIQQQLSQHFGDSSLSNMQTGNAANLVMLRDILAVGYLGDGRNNTKVKPHVMQGIEDVRWQVIQSAGLEEYALSLKEKRRSQKAVKDESDSASGNLEMNKERSLEDTKAKLPSIKVPQATSSQVGIGMDSLLEMTGQSDHSSLKVVDNKNSNSKQTKASRSITRRDRIRQARQRNFL